MIFNSSNLIRFDRCHCLTLRSKKLKEKRKPFIFIPSTKTSATITKTRVQINGNLMRSEGARWWKKQEIT